MCNLTAFNFVNLLATYLAWNETVYTGNSTHNVVLKPNSTGDLFFGLNPNQFVPGDGHCDVRYLNGRSDRIVCACTEDFCDNYELEWPQKFGEIFVYQSSEAGKRFERIYNDQEEHDRSLRQLVPREIRVNVTEKHQKIMGWGGAVTDTAAFLANSLRPEVSQVLMEAMYGRSGSRFNMGRVPMGATDFSFRFYSYDDQEEDDFELKNWSLTSEDHKLKIPFIRRAIELVNQTGNGDLKLVMTPFGAPKWLVDNRQTAHGFLKNELAYQARALSFVKFLDAYKQEGIRFWGATIQNQVVKLSTNHDIPSVFFCNNQIVEFVGQHLGPTLEQHGYGLSDDFQLLVGDESVGLADFHVRAIMDNPQSSQYISGLAYHNYMSGKFGLGYDLISELYEPYRERGQLKYLLMTEGCENNTHIKGYLRSDPGDWTEAEHYASDIIEDLLRDTQAWIDWNLALDLQSGPNYLTTKIDATIIVDPINNEFYKAPSYYTLSHFSRFFRPNSIRVGVSPQNFDELWRDLMYVAVKNEDTGHLLVNVLNRADQKQKIKLLLDGLADQEFELEQVVLDPRSLTTIIIKI